MTGLYDRPPARARTARPHVATRRYTSLHVATRRYTSPQERKAHNCARTERRLNGNIGLSCLRVTRDTCVPRFERNWQVGLDVSDGRALFVFVFKDT